jgi:hypothetical protein
MGDIEGLMCVCIGRGGRGVNNFTGARTLMSPLLQLLRSSANTKPEPEFVNFLRSPGIDFQRGGPVRQPYLTYRQAT